MTLPGWKKPICTDCGVKEPDLSVTTETDTPDLWTKSVEPLCVGCYNKRQQPVPRVTLLGQFLIRSCGDQVDIYTRVPATGAVAGDWWLTVRGEPGVDRLQRAIHIVKHLMGESNAEAVRG